MSLPSRSAKLLIVSNSPKTGPLWAHSLEADWFDVITEGNPEMTHRRWSQEHPNLVILDINAPQEKILDVIRSLREESTVPILLLTPPRSDEYVLDAYAAGMDECILKPISPSVFHAKVKAWLRRSNTIPTEILDPLRVGDVQLTPSERTVAINGRQSIRLTNLEMRLLYALMNRPSRTVTDEELVERIWGYDGEADNIALKNVVYRLRRKIEEDPASPSIILTSPGAGYKFASNP